MTGLTKKSHKPYPRVRRSRKTVFTPAIWARWMGENPRLSPPSDGITLRLRAGITEFRDRLRVSGQTEAQS
jgi:hypothetical protein